MKERESARQVSSSQKLAEKEAALQHIREVRLSQVDSHMEKLKKDRQELTQGLNQKNQVTQEKTLLDEKSKQDIQIQQQQEQEKRKLEQQQIRQKLEQQRQQDKEKAEQKKKEQEDLRQKQELQKQEALLQKKEQEKQMAEEQEAKKQAKKIQDFQNDQCKIFERKFNDQMANLLKIKRLLKEKEQMAQQQQQLELKKEEERQAKELMLIEKKKEMNEQFQKEQTNRFLYLFEKQLHHINSQKLLANAASVQAEQQIIFEKKFEQWKEICSQQKPKPEEVQNEQSAIFEQKFNQYRDLVNQRKPKPEEVQNEQSAIFEQKFNQYRDLVNQRKPKPEEVQKEQSAIFEQKFNQYKDLVNQRQPKPEEVQKEQSAIFEQKFNQYKDLVNQRQPKPEEVQKEQSAIFEQKFNQYKDLVNQRQPKPEEVQKEQSAIFEQKFNLYKDLVNQRKPKPEEVQNEQSAIFEQKFNQYKDIVNKQKQLQQEIFQNEQLEIFEDKFHDIQTHIMQKKAQEYKPTLQKQKTPVKLQENSDSELEYPDEDIEIDDDYDEPTPKKRNNQQFEDSEDYLKASKGLYQGGDKAKALQEPQNEEPEETTTQPLIQLQDLEIINQIIEDNYKDQLSPELEHCQDFEAMNLIFEEFIVTGKAFFFPIDFGQYFIPIIEQFCSALGEVDEEQAFESVSEDLSQLFQSMQEFYQQQTQQVQFSPMSRFFIPLIENPFNIFLIEIMPGPQGQHIVNLYLTGMCEEDVVKQGLTILLSEVFLQKKIFQLQQCNLNQIFIKPSQNFIRHAPQVKYLLVAFCVIYELDQEQFFQTHEAITIDQGLENRLNITVTSALQIRQVIEQDQQQYLEVFDQLIQESDQEQKHAFKMAQIQADENENFQEQVAQEIDQLMEFTTHLESGFMIMEIILGEEKFTYYACTYKVEQEQFAFDLFMLEAYPDEVNSMVGQTLLSFQENHPEFHISFYIDFARNSQIYDLGQVCLGIWVGLVDQCGMDPLTAFKLISYNQLPNLMLLG